MQPFGLVEQTPVWSEIHYADTPGSLIARAHPCQRMMLKVQNEWKLTILAIPCFYDQRLQHKTCRTLQLAGGQQIVGRRRSLMKLEDISLGLLIALQSSRCFIKRECIIKCSLNYAGRFKTSIRIRLHRLFCIARINRIFYWLRQARLRRYGGKNKTGDKQSSWKHFLSSKAFRQHHLDARILARQINR